jgi:AcrR family transcriptional regulator
MSKTISRRKRAYDPSGTRARILDAACGEFQRRGYHATSMQDVMGRAAVPGGSLYHYFPTKKSLGIAVIAERVAEIINDTWIGPLSKAPSTFEGIADVFDSVAESLERNGSVSGCPLNNLVLELSLADKDFQGALRAIFDSWEQSIAQRLREDLAAGTVGNVDPKGLATLVVALFSGAMSLAKAAQDAAPVRACRRELFLLLRTKPATQRHVPERRFP